MRKCFHVHTDNCLTCNDGGKAPANGVIESHLAVIDIAHLCQHTVNVQPLHKHPGEGTHIGVVQQNSHHCTHKLHIQDKWISTSALHFCATTTDFHYVALLGNSYTFSSVGCVELMLIFFELSNTRKINKERFYSNFT